MGAGIHVAVARARRQGETLPLPARNLGPGVLGVLASASADVEEAVIMLAGVRALVRSIR